MATASPWIIEPTLESFQTEIVDRSHTVPVVIDFWATWCQPCVMLAPILEKLANEFQGKFILAKIETEKNPELAGAFGVQSIPLVVAMRDGQPVDGFQGALPESAVREWLARILPSEAETLISEANAVAESDPTLAEAKYREAISLNGELTAARLGLGRVLLQTGRAAETLEIIAELEKRGFLEPEAEQLKAQSELQAVAAGHSGELESLKQRAAQAPQDIDLQMTLAETLAASGRAAEALEICLSHIARDRTGSGVRAKEVMVTILGAMTDHELAGSYRRKLATLLY